MKEPAIRISAEKVHTVVRGDVRASAEKILYTYLLTGSEREIVLPQSITNSVTNKIEKEGRDDPEIFVPTLDYIFQAMDRDAFPGFLNLRRPVFRIFSKSRRLGVLVNKLSNIPE